MNILRNHLRAIPTKLVVVPLLLLGLWRFFATASLLAFLVHSISTVAVQKGIWSGLRCFKLTPRIRNQSLKGALGTIFATGILPFGLTKLFFASSGVLPILFRPGHARWYHFVNALSLLLGLVGIRRLPNLMKSVRNRYREAAARRAEAEDDNAARRRNHVLAVTDSLKIKCLIKDFYHRGMAGCVLVDSVTRKSLLVEFHGPGLGDGRHIEFEEAQTFEEAAALARMRPDLTDVQYPVLLLEQSGYLAFSELLHTNASINIRQAPGRRLHRGILL